MAGRAPEPRGSGLGHWTRRAPRRHLHRRLSVLFHSRRGGGLCGDSRRTPRRRALVWSRGRDPRFGGRRGDPADQPLRQIAGLTISLINATAISPQAGIFALGTASHSYVEFAMGSGVEARDLVTAIASLREPRTTMGGVNLVAGFRPELWRKVAADASPRGLEDFNRDVVGPGDYRMPATQHDAVLWISGSAYDVVFDVARQAIAALDPLALVAEETSSWPYHHDRDLTGFIDGTENPSLIDAPDIAL
ncbi:MAG: hypothetical protein E6I67_02120, partial [Chloroflexi bacterium]